ncbi:MAG: oxaloacetate-decarboxylating malate dehydrogenase [Sandaracinus sp.]
MRQAEPTLRGAALLADPFFNRDLAFTPEERRALGIESLLPSRVMTLAEQVAHTRAQVLAHPDALSRYVALRELESRNAVLFYRLLADHLEEMAPLVYTPTVGDACRDLGFVHRRPRGLWIGPGQRGRIEEVLRTWAATWSTHGPLQLVVVTDNERILGLGDLGAGGMGIPVGKLALYTVAAGIHPARTLPISLDVGTDNRALLDDPSYLGLREPRLRGPAYDALVEELVVAVAKVFPEALLQWEDFKKANAIALLDRYRERLLSFNDDIEGTAAVALAGVLAATRARGLAIEDERVVIVGAGAAGLGIARLIGLELASRGVPADRVRRSIGVLDSRGLLVEGRSFDEPYKATLAWPLAHLRALGLDPATGDLAAVIRAFRPTMLIGTSGTRGAFDEASIRAMAQGCDRPAIFPLSNPNSAAEADPADLTAWTEGRAWIATGSPFPDVAHGGRTRRIAQGNNVWIFPGVGLGALAAKARRITDAMFVAAAHAVAEAVTAEDLEAGALYPSIDRLRRVTPVVARAVALAAMKSGAAPQVGDGELEARMRALRWEPAYA